MNSLSRNQIIVGIFIVFLTVTGLFAWYKRNNLDYASIPANCDVEVDSITSLPDGEIEKELQEVKTEQAKIKNYVNNENYAELDYYAHQLRTGKIRYSHGEWKLGTFYLTISSPAIENPGTATKDEWQKHINRLKKWVEQNPGSITARVSLASALSSYAQRREMYSNEEDIIESYKNRTAEVAQILEEAKQIPEKCPHWYYEMLNIAYVNHWDVEQYDQLFNEAINFEPLYEDLYIRKVQYLKKHAGDKKGEIAKFADEVSAKLGKEGQRIYSRIAFALAGTYGMDIFDHTELSWEKVFEGYKASDELFGESVIRLNWLCYFAAAANDIKLVRKLMKRIGNNVYTRVWSTKYYGKIKNWAFKQCQN